MDEGRETSRGVEKGKKDEELTGSLPFPSFGVHRHVKMKVETCSFSGYKIYPGKVRFAVLRPSPVPS